MAQGTLPVANTDILDTDDTSYPYLVEGFSALGRYHVAVREHLDKPRSITE